MKFICNGCGFTIGGIPAEKTESDENLNGGGLAAKDAAPPTSEAARRFSNKEPK
jgi:hypothetical protein